MIPRRRALLLAAGATATALTGCESGSPAQPASRNDSRGPVRVLQPDVLVAGGGVGGVAAALALLRAHRTVVLTDPTDWVGGQLTSQGVLPDEHSWIEEGLGATRTYREMRTRVREEFLRTYPVTELARRTHRRTRRLDPGLSWAALLSAEPRIWHLVLRSALAPYEATDRLRLFTRTRPIAAAAQKGVVQAVRFATPDGDIRVEPRFVIDATELGDLLPLARVPYVVGRERGPGGTEEPSNLWNDADPRDQQAYTVVGALGFAPARKGVPVRTPSYEKFKRIYETFPERKRNVFDPTKEWKWERAVNFWQYRRVRFHGYLTDSFLGDVTLLNMPQNDYEYHPLIPPEGPTDPELFDALAGRASELTKGLIQYFQLDYPRPDGSGGTGWGGLFPVAESLGTPTGLAQHPYIRESRRIRAEATIREQDVTTRATRYRDSVGVGVGPIDLHTTRRFPRGLFLPTYPFEIPLRALIPRGTLNLLAGAKNLGTTHISNGCYRYHPIEWSIGEAAGHALAFALERRVGVRDLLSGTTWTAFDRYLDEHGVQRHWSSRRANTLVKTFHS